MRSQWCEKYTTLPGIVPYLRPPLEVSSLLTLFSKFFATFPHGTCLLSIYRLYLALGGTYLPSLHCTIKQCDSPNAQRVGLHYAANRALTFYGAVFQQT